MELKELDGAVRLADDHVSLTVSRRFGPRITELSYCGSSNLLAVLPDAVLDLPDGRTYAFRGGHRLWAAPEVPAVTYEPDDEPVEIIQTESGVRVRQVAKSRADIEKQMTIAIESGPGHVTVEHTLRNIGEIDIDAAPWALTQFPIGGTALLPLALANEDADGLLPNESIIVWPYTGRNGSPFSVERRMVVIEAQLNRPSKVGTSLERGWLAYVCARVAFVKRASHRSGDRYVDRGAAAQCYCDSRFVELETLGPLVTLSPGGTTTHVETWELHDLPSDADPLDVPDIAGLDAPRRGES